MREDRNPSGHRGHRNLFCSDYTICLDMAISKCWNSWNCRRCKYRFNQSAEARRTTISPEEIVEYGLMIQPGILDYTLPDNDFNSEYDVATIY